MTLLHLSTNPRAEAAGWNFPLGIAGFRFADLNRVRRIAELDSVFRQELKAADPDLSDDYEEYRLAEGKGLRRAFCVRAPHSCCTASGSLRRKDLSH